MFVLSLQNAALWCPAVPARLRVLCAHPGTTHAPSAVLLWEISQNRCVGVIVPYELFWYLPLCELSQSEIINFFPIWRRIELNLKK